MTPVAIALEVGDTSFTLRIGDIVLEAAHGRLARAATDTTLLLASTGGTLTPKLRAHFTEHFGPSQLPSGQCEFCKLQGKLLAAEGRRRLTEREQRDRAKPPQHGVTVLRTGLSGAGLERAARASEVREAERLRKLPKLNHIKPGRDTEGVWF
jgi:hypothetical protein